MILSSYLVILVFNKCSFQQYVELKCQIVLVENLPTITHMCLRDFWHFLQVIWEMHGRSLHPSTSLMKVQTFVRGVVLWVAHGVWSPPELLKLFWWQACLRRKETSMTFTLSSLLLSVLITSTFYTDKQIASACSFATLGCEEWSSSSLPCSSHLPKFSTSSSKSEKW